MRIRFTITSLLLASLAGCASQRAARTSQIDTPIESAVAQSDDRAEGVAVALAFDPALTIGEPPLQLSREGRERSAFVGFEDQTVISFYIRIDDRDFGDGRGRYDRRAIIEKVGTTYR